MEEYRFIYESSRQKKLFYFGLIVGLFIGAIPAIVLYYCFFSIYQTLLYRIIMVGSMSVFAVIGMCVGTFIGLRFPAHGNLKIFSGYAVLNYEKNKKLTLKSGEFRVNKVNASDSSSDSSQKCWEIITNGNKYRFRETFDSEKRSIDHSLSLVMTKLAESDLPTLVMDDHRGFKIGDVFVKNNVSTPEVFAHSPYYVDYSSFNTRKGDSYAICYVREIADPVHVVGDVFFDDDEDNELSKPDSVLMHSIIVDGEALDERKRLGIKA